MEEEEKLKYKVIEEQPLKKTNKTIVIIGICLLAIIILGIALNLRRNVNNNVNNNSSNNVSTNDEKEGYDKKTYKVGDLYFTDFNNYLNNPETTTTVKYNDGAYIDGEITIENDNIYLKYEKDGVIQNNKINIGNEIPKYVMVIYANVLRYVYILTKNGNVYLNDNGKLEDFLNFKKVNNLSNVSEMFLHGQMPFFLISDKIYNKYGEIANHDILIKQGEVDMQKATGYDYYMQVSNEGLLYKNIIKKDYVIGSPEPANSILTHQKQENELYRNTNEEEIFVSALFGIDNDTFMIDKSGNYYKIDIIDNKEIKLNNVNSKSVISIDKYQKSSIVHKIEINYSDGTKDTYTINAGKSMW